MGNSLACFSSSTFSKSSTREVLPPWISPSAPLRKSRKSTSSSSSSPPKKTSDVFDDSYIKQQAQIASMLYRHHLQNNNGGDLLLHLDRSISTRNPPSSKNSKKFAKRSQSVSSSNPLSSLQLPNLQDIARNDGEEKKHFLLVHGGGFGAWCWYKIIALLKESNCDVDAIDLTGSGANFCDINSIKTIAQYAKPLTDFLANLPHDKEVVLVGHDLGGACISYAMEMSPSKVSRAVFVAATMLKNGQSALDVISKQSGFTDLNQNAQKFIYANGKEQQPTAMDYDKSLLEDFLFNRTPSKDVALASVSMRGVPFAPVTEKLSLSAEKYGSIPRFYIKTDEDFAMPEPMQEAMIQSDPPKQVFHLKGADHSPFLSKPQALLRLLLEISNIKEVKQT